ncbi:MAG: hypothetical protein FWG64_02755 [Firmicutes bacterium]|nr:hypothetical protein [Bacillota bacterium]
MRIIKAQDGALINADSIKIFRIEQTTGTSLPKETIDDKGRPFQGTESAPRLVIVAMDGNGIDYDMFDFENGFDLEKTRNDANEYLQTLHDWLILAEDSLANPIYYNDFNRYYKIRTIPRLKKLKKSNTTDDPEMQLMTKILDMMSTMLPEEDETGE